MSEYSIEQQAKYPFYKNFYHLSKDHIYNIANSFDTLMFGSYPTTEHIRGTNEIPNNYKNKLTEKYNGNFCIIKSDWEEMRELNDLTDYFTEECRIKCRFYNNMSPAKYWKKNHKYILAHLKNKFGVLNPIEIRNELFNRIKFCNNFQVTLAIGVLRIFCCRKWLDISAGWGDRLIAAILYGCDKYTGVDPNDCLQPKYTEIISSLANDHNKFNVIHGGFETANIPDSDYDLVFTSPPFYDKEFYSTSSGDSLVNYKTEQEWYEKFLLFSLNKAYQKLIKGGHMVLYIDEGKNTTYINKMIDDVNKIMKYNGIIYVTNNKGTLKKLYVWKK